MPAHQLSNGPASTTRFSPADAGIGRSYHADLGCPNTERRIHYLLEPGWRADQAIQGLGRTHRTHQASAPLFRPVATDVKGERRFIATIARRLDSLGAITRGQRDSQTAMGDDDTALFRASDNLESLYAKSALRQFYIALWRGNIAGWSLADFEEATGLKLVYEGNLKEDLPPMPQFLNRLLALPIDEQNQLFGALETRIEANIEIAVEAGTFERGVETIAADSLSVASRETVFTHEGSGAETEIVEIARKDRLEPLAADAAIELHTATSRKPPLLIVNAQSKRAALVMDAPARTLDDGDVQERVRLVRPAVRETMARAALEASQWRADDEDRWRALWDAEIAGLPSHRESRFWLVAGLLLPIWDRLPDESMRVRRLVTDPGTGPGQAQGEHLIGRVLGPAEVSEFRAALGLDGGPGLTAAEVHDEIMVRGASFPLANGWKLARRRLMGAMRIEIEGPTDTGRHARSRREGFRPRRRPNPRTGGSACSIPHPHPAIPTPTPRPPLTTAADPTRASHPCVPTRVRCSPPPGLPPAPFARSSAIPPASARTAERGARGGVSRRTRDIAVTGREGNETARIRRHRIARHAPRRA